MISWKRIDNGIESADGRWRIVKRTERQPHGARQKNFTIYTITDTSNAIKPESWGWDRVAYSLAEAKETVGKYSI